MVFYKRKITVSDDVLTSAVHLTLKQSIIPCLLGKHHRLYLGTVLIDSQSRFYFFSGEFSVTVYLICAPANKSRGFAYGLLDVLNPHFQKSLNITASMSSGLSAAYFGAYFLCPTTISGWILRKWGFRITFMTGLAVLSVGCLLMWPSGVKHSFEGFCGAMFVVGSGLSTLETAADPFLSICGPPRYSEIRLNLAQGVQAVGSFTAPLLASRVFFAKTVDTDQGLKNVQWVYLGVACFVSLLIILFSLAPMPEITDADMSTQELEIAEYNPGPLKKQVNLFLAVWSQFCYVGAQVAIANYFVNFCEEAGKDASTSCACHSLYR